MCVYMCIGAQHSYIVACPRVASPFDEAEQAAEYPHEEYCFTMLRLGAELMSITRRFKLSNRHRFSKVFFI